jgi:SAM-dependent methyltransferase
VDRALASAVAHRWHPVAAPVSDRTVARLLEHLHLGADSSVLDLGCGPGEWLQRALTATTGAQGVGVDTSGPALEAARAATARRGLADRLTVQHADASTWTGSRDEEGAGSFDAVLCVGVGHVFGGPAATLDAARRHLSPGGRVLLGEGFWEGVPDRATLEALDATPDEQPSLPELVDTAAAAGFEPGWGHVSSAGEWDDYEWSWTGALAQWALTEARGPEAAEALELARSHRRGWLGGYRGRLGFLTVVLQDVGTPG